MKFTFKSIVLFVAVATMLMGVSSCQKDPEAPVITGLEVGIGNSLVGRIGSDLHIDAEIVAEGKIDKIKVEIHPESGSGEDIEVEFTDDAGKKNTDFHEHIDIPASTTPGDYHFHLKVYDKQGNMSSAEADITLE